MKSMGKLDKAIAILKSELAQRNTANKNVKNLRYDEINEEVDSLKFLIDMLSKKLCVANDYIVETSDGSACLNFTTTAFNSKGALANLIANSSDFMNICNGERDLSITVKNLTNRHQNQTND